MLRFVRSLVIIALFASYGHAADIERQQQLSIPSENRQVYYWKAEPVGETAQLLTLFCRSCEPFGATEGVPLIAVLRDTLGDTSAANDRVTCIWLLSYARPNWHQRLLSAVPFFYWRVGSGSEFSGQGNVPPLMDLTAPHHRVLSAAGRDLLQWTTFDPISRPVRASTRAYRTNEIDDERLHLEEAISYLRNAPVSNDASGLTRTQLDTVTARLELRKKLLGGFASEHQAAQLGMDSAFKQERIRSRNWELLRECADRTGLLFEPLDMVSDSKDYVILWFPLGETRPAAAASLGSVWKLLNIKDPWTDKRLKNWGGATYERAIDDGGRLLPSGESADGDKLARLVPLGVYSLNYPKVPLLLIDFRDKLHIKGHELAQRTINEITAGVLGLSHFTNWYYFVGADIYDFVMSRWGGAMDQSERLDCYSRFRVAITLDGKLDPALRKDMQQRINSLAVNPLEAAPQREIHDAMLRYTRLQEEAAPGGALVVQLDKDRRSELASFGQSKTKAIAYDAMHVATLNHYTHRAKPDIEDLVLLDCYRRTQTQLHFLDSLVQAGTPPEVAYSSSAVQDAVAELNRLLPRVQSAQVRSHARNTLEELRLLSEDTTLQAECTGAIGVLDLQERNGRNLRPGTAPGFVAAPMPQAAEALP